MNFRSITCALELFALSLGLSTAALAETGSTAFERMSRELEVRLALSALPSHLRGDATVYTLNPATGFELEKQGKNGFACFVYRTDWQRAEYIKDLLIPICFDEEGTKSLMPVYFDVEKIRAEGKLSATELNKLIASRFDDGTYHVPARVGISYMIAPVMRSYTTPGKNIVATMSMPHYMIYAPNVANNDIGGGRPLGQNPFVLNPGPHGYIIILAGEAEKAKINGEFKDLLKDLCDYRSDLCLDADAPMHSHG